MPGFTIGGQGGGPNNVVETRRKHRWIFQTLADGAFQGGREALLILQSASRPHVTFEEPEMHHNQEKAYFAGKHAWEPITLVWYDGEQSPDVSSEVYTWIDSGVLSSFGSANVNPPNQYKKDSTLQMLDGAGAPTETWNILGCWPQDVNWGDLDYTNTEIQTIEVTMRYDRAIRQ
jgi:hypothetical protein